MAGQQHERHADGDDQHGRVRHGEIAQVAGAEELRGDRDQHEQEQPERGRRAELAQVDAGPARAREEAGRVRSRGVLAEREAQHALGRELVALEDARDGAARA